MAKTQKYSEDQLIEAVVKFAEVEKKKIKATELAEWSRRNIEGLEEVRDYHFTRPIKERDKKTGKIIEKAKLCTLKIEEINKARSLITNIKINLLLSSSNIEVFLEQPDAAKRKMIVETRETVDKLLARERNITRENEVLKIQNKALMTEVQNIESKISSFEKKHNKLFKQVAYLMKATDIEARKAMLSQMGIDNESIDLNTYMESLTQELKGIMDINKIIRSYYSDKAEVSMNETKMITEEIMSGLDF